MARKRKLLPVDRYLICEDGVEKPMEEATPEELERFYINSTKRYIEWYTEQQAKKGIKVAEVKVYYEDGRILWQK